LPALTDLVSELRYYREQVPHHEKVRKLADWCVRILVDGHHVLRGLHADPVLDGTTDADAQVERRLYDLAGLADLQLVGHPAGVGRGAACTNCATQRIRQLLQRPESLRAADAAAAGNDHGRLLEVGHGGLGRMRLDDPRLAERPGIGRWRLADLGRAAAALAGSERIGEGKHHRRLGRVIRWLRDGDHGPLERGHLGP
jgi:hypothetical protein